MIIGIWIPNLYYWGLNQYIVQRTLGARSLADGQRGVVFAASLKLIVPFIVCIPGVIAFALYGEQLRDKASRSINAPTLALFDEVKSQPGTAGCVFKFNEDFAKLYPDRAEEVFVFNSEVAGTLIDQSGAPDSDAAKQVVKINSDVIKQAVTVDPALKVQTELVGYDYDCRVSHAGRGIDPHRPEGASSWPR